LQTERAFHHKVRQPWRNTIDFRERREGCHRMAIATKTWNGPDQPTIPYAFAANNISHPIYSSEQNSKRDRAAMETRFVIPVVVGGRAYFGV
jgi:hypothetical protein